MRRVIYFVILFSLFFVMAAAEKAEPEKAVAEKSVQEKSKLTVEAELCTSVEERMPVGSASNFSAEVGKVYLWTKVLGAVDPTVVYHVWYYKDKEMARVELAVKSNAWRTYSSKNILPHWTGDWAIKIEDADGNILKEMTFNVGGVN